MPGQQRKVLIVGPAWVGDMVMAQSLFIRLLERRPDTQIDVLAPDWTRPLLARMPQVAHTIDMPLGHGEMNLSLRNALGQRLKEEAYDQAIVLPNSLKSALVPWFAEIPLRTGWLGEFRYFLLNDVRKLSKRRLPLMVQRFVALAHEPGFIPGDDYPLPALAWDRERAQALMTSLSLSIDRPVLALCPGAEFGPSKQWPAGHFAQLANWAVEEGRQVWLLGSAKDEAFAADIMAQAAGAELVHNLCGRTTLEDAIDLLGQAEAVVSNDSGLMHVAAALKRPLVVLYGSTSADFTPPLGQRVASLSLGLDCSPCFKRECPLQHHRCMKDLSPESVKQALTALIEEHCSPAQSPERT